MSIVSLSRSRRDNSELDLKISKDDQTVYTLMNSVFLLKIPAGFWNLCPDLSIDDSLRLDSFDIKIDRKHAVKKVLDLAER